MNFFGHELWGNTVQSYLSALGLCFAVILAIRVLRYAVTHRLSVIASQTSTRLDDVLINVIQSTKSWVAGFVGVFAGSQSLQLSPAIVSAIRLTAVTAVVAQIGIWANTGIVGLLSDYRAKKEVEGDTATVGTVALMSMLARLVVWVVVLLLALDNFGVDVTTLIAGLGIGGIAIAMAVRGILEDIFASISIVLDKPFEVGDGIVVDGDGGTVVHIGLKTTRVRTSSGEQLVFSNGELLSSRIRNFKRMQERRIVLNFSVPFETPPEKLEQIPGVVERAVSNQEHTRFDRAHLRTFGEWALQYEAIYYMTDPAFGLAADAQQEIHLQLLREFRSMDIALAHRPLVTSQ